jgi:hypothetical protein
MMLWQNGTTLLIFWNRLPSTATETASFSEMTANIYQSKWCHIPEHMNHHQHHCENLQSHFETLTPPSGGGGGLSSISMILSFLKLPILKSSLFIYLAPALPKKILEKKTTMPHSHNHLSLDSAQDNGHLLPPPFKKIVLSMSHIPSSQP